MNLSERQKKYLRRAAHALKPVVTVGEKGVTDAVIAELNSSLEHHELIKIRVRVGERLARGTAIDELAMASGATLVSSLGNTATLYRPRKKNPVLVLPLP